jgi:hypothetical protein
MGQATYLRDGPGRWTYHYTSREAAFRHIVPERRLRLSPYSRMRDPLEARDWGFRFSHPPGADPSDEVLRREIDEAYDATVTLRQTAKLLSLGLDARGYEAPFKSFGSGLARPRMWEQYGERHHGVCLVFDRERLHSVLTQQLQDAGSRFYCGGVRYTKAGIAGEVAALTLDVDLIRRHGLDETLARHMDRFHKALFLTKLLDWKSEHEYRYIVLTDPTKPYEFANYGDALRAIFLGHMYPEPEESIARSLAGSEGLDLYRLEWVNGAPSRTFLG